MFPCWMNLRMPPDFSELVRQCNEMTFVRERGLTIDVSENATAVLKASAFTMISGYDQLALARVSFKQLGLKGKVSRKEIYLGAEKLGLVTCPPQTGPQLRLDFLTQQKGDRLAIGHEPIIHDGFSDIFTLDHHGQTLWLRAVSGSANVLWDDEFEWIFMIPEPKVMPLKRVKEEQSSV